MGRIDGDFRDQAYLSSLSGSAIVVLPLHEAESFLCLPEVIVAIAERIGSQERALTTDHVRELIVDSLKAHRVAVAARRVFARSRVSLAVSLERSVIATASTRDELVRQLKSASEGELAKATLSLGADQLEAAVDSELMAIDMAIDSNDPLLILRLLPAKELLNALAPKAGCKNGTDLMRALKKNFEPTAFSALANLRQALESRATT